MIYLNKMIFFLFQNAHFSVTFNDFLKKIFPYHNYFLNLIFEN